MTGRFHFGSRGCSFSEQKNLPSEQNQAILKSSGRPLGECRLKKSPHNIFAYPYTFTAKEMQYTAPQSDFLWERMPTDNDDVYLVPVMPKSFLHRKIETQN